MRCDSSGSEDISRLQFLVGLIANRKRIQTALGRLSLKVVLLKQANAATNAIMSCTPNNKDRQISPHPTVDRTAQGKFFVCDLVRRWAGPDWNHTLYAECSYCHQTIEILLRAPLNVAKFAQDEACRIAILEHLRTEHPTPQKKQP